MTTAVSRRYNQRESEDDSGSEVSTMKGINVFKSGSCKSFQTFSKTRYVNSATCIEHEFYKGVNCSSGSDDAIFDDDDQTVKKPPSITKTCRIDLSPEAETKRREAFDKWLKSVIAREKERKRIALKRLEADVEAHRFIEESRKQKSEEKIEEWMRKKQIEAEKKMLRLAEMKKAAEAAKNKQKEFKKAVNFQDWLNRKEEDFIQRKKQQDETKKQSDEAKKTYRKCRKIASSASYDKWVRLASSKAKPVPLNQGLASLRGSTTKIFINPEPWKFED